MCTSFSILCTFASSWSCRQENLLQALNYFCSLRSLAGYMQYGFLPSLSCENFSPKLHLMAFLQTVKMAICLCGKVAFLIMATQICRFHFYFDFSCFSLKSCWLMFEIDFEMKCSFYAWILLTNNFIYKRVFKIIHILLSHQIYN